VSEVEHVAVWVGLILAVAGIALAIVSMLFTWVVNKRAETLNDQTVKALTKLETDMERVSDDVRGLIRDAWSRLVIGSSVEEVVASPQDQAALPAATPPKVVEAAKPPAARPDPYARTVELVRRLSPEAQWLLRVLHQKGGLTIPQYTRLRRTPLGRPLFELTQSGLVGVYGVPSVEEDRYVEGIRPEHVDAVRIALSLLDDPAESVKAAVAKELVALGYDGEGSETTTKAPAAIVPPAPVVPSAAKPPPSDQA
jgi:hypothetical protein